MAEPSVDAVLAAVAAWSVAAADPAVVHRAATGLGGDALALVDGAAREQLLGPLVLAAEEGLLVLPDEARDAADRKHAGVQGWCQVLDERLVEVADRLAADGAVEVRVLKGAATARLDEVHPAMRAYSDVDLLVRGPDIDRAVARIEGLGAVRPWPQRRPGFDARFAKSVTLTFPDGVEIDLHRTLCDGAPGARIPLDRLYDEPDGFEIGDRRFLALAPHRRLLHAAHHAILGSPSPRLLTLRDLAGLLTRTDLDPAVVLAEADRWQAVPVLVAAVEAAMAALPIEATTWQDLLAAHPTTASERRALERQRIEGSGLGWAKLDLLGELPDRRLQAAYLAAVVWPTRAHLDARGRTRRAEVVALLHAGVAAVRNRGRHRG